jgi:hypothetical protein
MQLHHTGLQEESQVAVPEEHTWTDSQELQAQEVPEEEEQGEELSESSRHRSMVCVRNKSPAG